MDTNIIKFRLSPECLNYLENARQDNESVHQAAKRMLEGTLRLLEGTRTQQDTRLISVSTQKQNPLEHSKDTHQDTVEQMMARLKAEVIEQLGSRLDSLISQKLGE